MTYRDSIYDPLNEAGYAANLRLGHGPLAGAVRAAVRSGQTPEALVGYVAGVAVAWCDDPLRYEDGGHLECFLPAIAQASTSFLKEEFEAHLNPAEAMGLLLSSVMDLACRVSLELRFESKET